VSPHPTRKGRTPEGRHEDARRGATGARAAGPGDAPRTQRDPRFTRAERTTEDVPVSPLVEDTRERERMANAPLSEPAVGPRGPVDWRSNVIALSGLNVVAGLWLIVAPFVLSYGDGDPIWNDVVFGAVTALIAVARASGAYRAAWLSLVNAAVGIWIFLSAFWLDETTTAGWNDVITGAVIAILAILSAASSEDGARDERAAPPL
jgi:hypothetical protein